MPFHSAPGAFVHPASVSPLWHSRPMQVHHRIDYIEFSVLDMARAKAFYEQAFGWAFTDYGPGYAGIQGGEEEQGGLALSETPNAGGSPLVILFSTELDASRAAVAEAGGTIKVEPFDFPGGRRFHFVDTEGNELAVWSKA